MDNEIEYITSSSPEEPEPVPFRDKHPNLYWIGITATIGGGLGLMRWLASFLIGGGEENAKRETHIQSRAGQERQ